MSENQALALARWRRKAIGLGVLIEKPPLGYVTWSKATQERWDAFWSDYDGAVGELVKFLIGY